MAFVTDPRNSASFLFPLFSAYLLAPLKYLQFIKHAILFEEASNFWTFVFLTGRLSFFLSPSKFLTQLLPKMLLLYKDFPVTDSGIIARLQLLFV